MGIEWFRDLSIIVLTCMTTAILIFLAVLAYRLYRLLKTSLVLIREASKMAYETVSLFQECIEPLLPVLVIIKGFGGGFQKFCNMFTGKNK